MPTVKINKNTSLSPKETFDKVTNLFETDKELQKLDPGYKCDFNVDELTGTAKGSQFKATMAIKPDGDGSEVDISVDLPFHLGLVKGLVKKTLEGKIEKLLS